MAQQQSNQQGKRSLSSVPDFLNTVSAQAVAVNSFCKVKEKPDANEAVQKKKDDNPGQQWQIMGSNSDCGD